MSYVLINTQLKNGHNLNKVACRCSEEAASHYILNQRRHLKNLGQLAQAAAVTTIKQKSNDKQ